MLLQAGQLTSIIDLLPQRMSYRPDYHFRAMKNSETDQPSTSDQDTPHEADPRVAAALDEICCPYEIDEEQKTFRIRVHIDENRSHGVIVGSRTLPFMDVELRRIVAIGFTSEEPFDSRTANLLLRENADIEFGSWSIVFEEGIHYAFFSAAVSATINPRVLGDLIAMVARTADAMEYRLTGLDEH